MNLSISCPSGHIGAIRFAYHQGVFTFATFIERKFHCLFLMLVGGFQFQMRSFLFDLPINLNRDFDF